MRKLLMQEKLAERASNRKEFTEKLKNLSLPKDAKVGVLLLHGLTGMPNEMRPVARALEALGCTVEVPMLPGHGFGHEEMLASGWKEWVAASKEAAAKLAETCDYVILGGLSMGALIPVLIAVENPNSKIIGMICMSPTIKYDAQNSSNPFQVFLPCVDFIPLLGRICYWTEDPPYGLKDERLQRMITKELEAARNGDKTGFGQFRTYAGSLRQLQHLVAAVKKQAHKLTCPVLILQSLEDTITSIRNPQTFYKWLSGSKDKQIIYLTGCDHVLPLDLKKEEVSYHCAAFVCRMVEAAVPALQRT